MHAFFIGISHHTGIHVFDRPRLRPRQHATRPCAGKNPPQPCVVQPTIITQAEPDYSDEAREKKVEGEVYLEFVVGVDGRTHDVYVTKSLGSGLDEKSIEAVKQWTFRPGTLDGNPVAVKLRGSVSFHILKR